MPQGGNKSGGSQGGDYQQYMDYQKYMPQGGGKNSSGAGGDYQQYMDYQKYMSQGGGKGGGKGGDYSKYYKQYMSQGESKNDTINLVASGAPPQSGGGGDYSKFYQSYVPYVKNWSNNDEVNAAFTGKYASSYVPPKSANESSDGSASVSAPALSLAASSDVPTPKSMPVTSNASSAPAGAPLDANVAVETVSVSKSSHTWWPTLFFLAAALPAAGVAVRFRKSRGSIADMEVSIAQMKLAWLQKFWSGPAEVDMTGYHLQKEEDNLDIL